MNTCYVMRKTDPLILLFAFFVLVAQVLSVPVDYPDPDTTDEEPVTDPYEPLSQIVFVNDLPPGETVHFEFIDGASIYVSSSNDKNADSYEENIHILRAGRDEKHLKMSDVGKEVNSETGEKLPIYNETHFKFDIRNNNSEKSTFKNPGIIYFVFDSDDEKTSHVYETSLSDHRNIFLQSDDINSHYVTLLNPSGAVKISDIHHIDGLTTLTVSAGGIEEATNTLFTIHDIGKAASHTGAALYFVEPVLTFHKQLSFFPGSSFEITARAVEIPQEVTIPMTWSDWSLGMSSNYMLRKESDSFKYTFNATAPNSKFAVQFFGEIAGESELKLSYDGIEEAGSETFRRKNLDDLYKSIRGQTLTVEYKKGAADETKGVLVRVECSQSSSTILAHIVFVAVFLRYLI